MAQYFLLRPETRIARLHMFCELLAQKKKKEEKKIIEMIENNFPKSWCELTLIATKISKIDALIRWCVK